PCWQPAVSGSTRLDIHDGLCEFRARITAPRLLKQDKKRSHKKKRQQAQSCSRYYSIPTTTTNNKGTIPMKLRQIVIACTLASFAGPTLAQQAPAAEQDTSMSFFTTSRGLGDGANLGGLAGADAHCAAL